MTRSTNLRRVRAAVNRLRRPGFGRSTARTAIYDVCATGLAAFISLVIAATLGAAGRGEYAAIMAWFGLLLVVGELGQTAATCFYAARQPARASAYVATARNLMVLTGAATLGVGILAAPYLSGGRPDLTWSYRIAFATCVLMYLATPYLAGLQAHSIARWNVARTSQSVCFMVAIGILIALDLMTLLNVIWAFAGAISLYAALTYVTASRSGLTGGRGQAAMVRPLARYGVSQMAALAPLAINSRLDQIVLSQTVPAADLGRYAVAVGLTGLAVPFVGAIGYVAFPRLASRQVIPGGVARFQRLALFGSAAVASAVLLPLAMMAHWLIPFALGPEFRESAELIWILMPGGVFLACGYVAADLLRGRNRPTEVACAYIVGSAVTVALLFGLLPSIGVAGAALSSSIGYLVSFAMMVHRLQRLPDESASAAAQPA